MPVHGYDWTTDAVAPYRSPQDGNSNGVALESEGIFQPPPQMTIEILLRSVKTTIRPQGQSVRRLPPGKVVGGVRSGSRRSMTGG